MRQIDTFEGARAIVQNFRFRILAIAALSLFALVFSGCGGSTADPSGPGGVDPNATAATVNGKAITMEEVDRAVKQQAQGQEAARFRRSNWQMRASRCSIPSFSRK